MNEILIAENIYKAFGRVQAVAGVDISVRQGEILGILGPNGSGKTTLFNLLAGAFKPDGGRIFFEGRDITRTSPARRCRMGMGRTFQTPRLFGDMTVFENLLAAGVNGGGLTEKQARVETTEILGATGLWSDRNFFARTLPPVGRKRLELARALATKPSLLLMDETAAGLTESEARELMELVRSLRDRGLTVVWIEHLLSMMEGVDRLLVLDQGRNLLCGEPGQVLGSEEVLACYMGSGEEG